MRIRKMTVIRKERKALLDHDAGVVRQGPVCQAAPQKQKRIRLSRRVLKHSLKKRHVPVARMQAALHHEDRLTARPFGLPLKGQNYLVENTTWRRKRREIEYVRELMLALEAVADEEVP